MENWKNKVTLACKRNNLDVSFRCLKYGYERAEISCASFREMQAVEAYFRRVKGLHITHWYVSSDRAFEGRVYIIGQDDYKALTENQTSKQKVVRKIPVTENGLGVHCTTKSGMEFQISQNTEKKKHTLWKIVAGGFEKVATANSPYDLYELIPWDK